jgi:colanic acid/amylovoran biosynthesis glycosyltransferase
MKGYEYALMALAMLRHRGIPATLDIIGTGEDIQRVRYATRDLGLDDAVTIAGALSPEHVCAAMKSHHALLLTSVSEGISNSVLEGMSSSLPVVTTDCGGMREAVANGVEGLVVPVRDAFAVAGALEWLFHHPSERRAMGQAGRHRVMEEFTLTQQINKWINMIHEAIDLAGRSS